MENHPSRDINQVAIVGCGFAGSYHVRGWRSNKVEVVAVVDVDISRARSFALENKVRLYFSNVEDLLSKVNIDAVSIATPPHTHKEIALKFIERGVHVFCEKPLTLTYRDAVELIDKARERGVIVVATSNYLYTPLMREAMSVIKRGDIGDVRRVDVLFKAPRAVIEGDGGRLRNLPGKAFGEVPHTQYTSCKPL